MDSPIRPDLLAAPAPPSDRCSDPNAALWLSIRPSSPPPWPTRLRERGALAFAVVARRLRERWPSWIASKATARDWVSSTILGLAVGLGVGLLARYMVTDPEAASRVSLHEMSAREPLRAAPGIGAASAAASDPASSLHALPVIVANELPVIVADEVIVANETVPRARPTATPVRAHQTLRRFAPGAPPRLKAGSPTRAKRAAATNSIAKASSRRARKSRR